MRDGKNRLICSSCGKRVGRIRIRRSLKVEAIVVGFIFIMVTQIIAEVLVNWWLFGGADRIIQ